MRILMIGDIVGQVGRQAVANYLPKLNQMYSPDVIVANGENAAGNGRGIQREILRELMDLGIHCVTLGNHAWAQAEVFDFIDEEPFLIRPANYPPGTPGKGHVLLTVKGVKVVVVNLMGRAYMGQLDCPFRKMDEILSRISGTPYILVDFHAETTSEKQALACYLDGKVSAVIGTHTHVQTADERILPKGTGYLTDVGMVGPYDSVIGMKKEEVVKRFITQMPVRFSVAKGREQFNAVLIDLDKQTKKTTKLTRIRIDAEHPLIG
ncbi:TIGR00282 family metallophosphoesterase [Thermoactinomyces intermedius]|jgi:2',3'-cyclic-nucleotide 2'-phosphodiesterase|uniref:TIGR00282 family metallophosphoesterase n=1 Tax=Thermoactinomyces intermedius TaxID=2024 RepID=A0A8I1DCY3_THEIN|nr:MULTISPECIES: TIGR00282 family metallophosphoesterase [Thermoactinomyces]MBA4549591.1 TIGR00282 family metallophosphoesterase [Thermoactinomyces intermedius]MBA4837241.1 TIGR00282 family metallophosphoesterase [Thermoactinomyces intermedius]MBH8595978.1 TIGR00282 family metallophosphoesterase [Thermoactinomyces intermedius]MBH8602212.1 TIGR00282 family metallophosphoesterase [Thermoactinomyces sp. CICC 23799]